MSSFDQLAFAKEKTKVKITTEDYPFNDKGYIVIKLVDSKGKTIHSKCKIIILSPIVKATINGLANHIMVKFA